MRKFRTRSSIGIPRTEQRLYVTGPGLASKETRRSGLAASRRKQQQSGHCRGNSMASIPLLQLQHVSRSLAGRCVVDDVNFELDRGQVLGLLGVNGAGKSTTLRMIAGILAPSAGVVRFEGVDLAEAPERARAGLGYLPERAPLYPELRVDEYLVFCAKLHGLRGRAAGAAADTA